MRLRFVALVIGLFLAAGTLASADQTVTPSAILAHPTSFDGHHVAVVGTISGIQERSSQRGNDYDIFQLCDTRCVRVFAWGHPTIGNGQRLTVHGTFVMTKHVGRYTFHNEIDSDDGSL